MIFQTHERDDGHFELILDTEGIDFLQGGLTELRSMHPGNELSTPSITSDGVSEFMLKRVEDGGQTWNNASPSS